MILFKRKKENTYPEYDRDKRTGHTEEIMYIRSQGDMQDFLSRYGLSEQEIKKEW